MVSGSIRLYRIRGGERRARLALVYALIGEKKHAITLIERLLSCPGNKAITRLASPTRRSWKIMGDRNARE